MPTTIRCQRCVRKGRRAPALAVVGDPDVHFELDRVVVRTKPLKSFEQRRRVEHLLYPEAAYPLDRYGPSPDAEAEEVALVALDINVRDRFLSAVRDRFAIATGRTAVPIECPTCGHHVKISAVSLRKLAGRPGADLTI